LIESMIARISKRQTKAIVEEVLVEHAMLTLFQPFRGAEVYHESDEQLTHPVAVNGPVEYDVNSVALRKSSLAICADCMGSASHGVDESVEELEVEKICC
jgi:hypothetical protein